MSVSSSYFLYHMSGFKNDFKNNAPLGRRMSQWCICSYQKREICLLTHQSLCLLHNIFGAQTKFIIDADSLNPYWIFLGKDTANCLAQAANNIMLLNGNNLSTTLFCTYTATAQTISSRVNIHLLIFITDPFYNHYFTYPSARYCNSSTAVVSSDTLNLPN